MEALGVLESKWNPIRQKLVRRLLEEQDKVLRSYCQVGHVRVKQERNVCVAKMRDQGECTG